MLLSEALKRTPDDHPDHGPLERATALIKEAAMFNNEMIRDRENREKIEEIESRWAGLRTSMVKPGRWFVREGTLIKKCRRADKPFEFVLFSDALVYGSSHLSSGNTGLASVKFHREIPLSECRVKECGAAADATLEVASSVKSFVVRASDEMARGAWVSDLRRCIGEARVGKNGYIAPVWVPNKDSPDCSLCSKAFTMFHRRHHCRKCGRVVCDRCSPHRKNLGGGASPQRVCEACIEEDSGGVGGGGTGSPRVMSAKSDLVPGLLSLGEGQADESDSSTDEEGDGVGGVGGVSGVGGVGGVQSEESQESQERRTSVGARAAIIRKRSMVRSTVQSVPQSLVHTCKHVFLST
jgi:hypothetical protein